MCGNTCSWHNRPFAVVFAVACQTRTGSAQRHAWIEIKEVGRKLCIACVAAYGLLGGRVALGTLAPAPEQCYIHVHN